MLQYSKTFVFVLISLRAKLIVQCVSHKVLVTAIDNKCFTNSPSAVAALYDLSDHNWKKTGQVKSDVKYVSENSKKLCENLDCYDSGIRWKARNSLELGHINNLVMDRRWEDFPMYFTKHRPPSASSENRQFQLVGVINNHDFVIPFSLHSKYEAHVFICDRSTCNWLKLQAYNNTATVFTTCKNHHPNTTITTEFCHNSTWKYDNHHLNNMFNYDKWSHFKIVKFGNELQFINETDDVLFKVNVVMKGAKDVFIHSKLVNGMWKIHNFTYLYSETQGATFFKFKIVPGQQCLSMFIAMCKRCSITMIFYYSDGAKKQSVLDYEYFNKTIDTWQYVMFCINISKEDLYLQVATHIENDQTIKAFWALSDIRTGQKDEFRYITPDPSTWSGKCQSLKSGSVLDKNAPNIEVLENWNVCKEYQIGEDCLPCNQFIEGGCPKQTKYCQLVNDSSGNITPKCYCSMGYEGSNCQEPCSEHKYGHSCQRSCKNCQGGCKNDGECNSPGHCLRDYFGEKCDTRLGIFLFANRPEINAGVTGCQLSQTTFAGTGRKVHFYKFQFRKDGEEEWKDVTEEPLEYNYIKPLILSGLKPDSTYQVRVFGFDEVEDLTQLSVLKDSIKIYSCTTRPKSLNPDNKGD